MFDAVVIAIVRGVSTDNWVTDCGGRSALKPNYLGPTATAALRCRSSLECASVSLMLMTRSHSRLHRKSCITHSSCASKFEWESQIR